MQQPSTSSLGEGEARRLLGLGDADSLTKARIQSAFIEAAQRYHPDSRHRRDASPCAASFRNCHEARRVLLARHCGSEPRSPDAARGHRTAGGGRRRFGRGFPFRTLRVLTLKQNLALRGIVLTVITVGTLYDEWTRKNHRRQMHGGQGPQLG